MSFQTALHQQFKSIYEQTDGFRKLQETLNKIATPAKELAEMLEKQSQILQHFPNKKIILKMNLYLTHWIVIDNCLLEKLYKINYSSSDDIENLIVSYYSENNWNQAEILIQSWRKFNFTGERVCIFLDALEVNRVSEERKGFNPNRLACPALIAQIDSLVEFLKKSIYSKCIESLNQNCLLQNWKKNKNEIVIKQIDHIVDHWSAVMLNNIIFNRLFCGSQSIPKRSTVDMLPDKNQEFLIFRNKILHGDQNYMDYGTKREFYQNFIICRFYYLSNLMCTI